jgi:Arc/MetJ-type ribon-helix-helix transcriptional regulator
MAKTRAVQVRVPEEFLRKIDRLIETGIYRSRSDVILDATRRLLERSMPPSPLELFVEKYLAGKVEPSREAEDVVTKLFEKVRVDAKWRKSFGETPDEVMDRLRRRLP